MIPRLAGLQIWQSRTTHQSALARIRVTKKSQTLWSHDVYLCGTGRYDAVSNQIRLCCTGGRASQISDGIPKKSHYMWSWYAIATATAGRRQWLICHDYFIIIISIIIRYWMGANHAILSPYSIRSLVIRSGRDRYRTVVSVMTREKRGTNCRVGKLFLKRASRVI